MKKYLVSAPLGALAMLSLMLGANMAVAATIPVTGWKDLKAPPSSTAIITGAGTNSPEVAPDAVTIGANFTTAGTTETLTNDGDFIELTGSVSFSDLATGQQFRWGLFDGDNPVIDLPNGPLWDGYLATGPNSTGSGQVYSKTGGLGGR